MYCTIDVREYCHSKKYASLVHVACEWFNETLSVQTYNMKYKM